jgi:hypothetical protein
MAIGCYVIVKELVDSIPRIEWEPVSLNLPHQQMAIDCYVIVKELLDPISSVEWEPESLHTLNLAGQKINVLL